MSRLLAAIIVGFLGGVLGGLLVCLSYALPIGVLMVLLYAVGVLTAKVAFLLVLIPFAIGALVFGTVGAIAGAVAD